jgi:hypothetical protein
MICLPLWSDEDSKRLNEQRAGVRRRAPRMFGRTEHGVRTYALSIGLKFPTIWELRRRAVGSTPQIEAREFIGNRTARGKRSAGLNRPA